MIIMLHDFDVEPDRPWVRGARVQVGPGCWRLVYTTEYDVGIVLRNIMTAIALAAERQRGEEEALGR